MNMQRTLPTATALAALLALSAAQAQTDTSSFSVLLQINETCDVSSTAPTDLNFGTATLLTGNIDQTSTITVLCTTGTDFDIGLDAGDNESTPDDITTRRMTNGAGHVGYQLYQDPGRTTVWGNTISTNTVSSSGTGSTQGFTVYGRVPAQTTPQAGSYADSITVTVTY